MTDETSRIEKPPVRLAKVIDITEILSTDVPLNQRGEEGNTTETLEPGFDELIETARTHGLDERNNPTLLAFVGDHEFDMHSVWSDLNDLLAILVTNASSEEEADLETHKFQQGQPVETLKLLASWVVIRDAMVMTLMYGESIDATQEPIMSIDSAIDIAIDSLAQMIDAAPGEFLRRLAETCESMFPTTVIDQSPELPSS